LKAEKASLEAFTAVAAHELRRAPADVHHEGLVVNFALRGRSAERQQALLVSAEERRREAVAPLDLAEERLARRHHDLIEQGAGRAHERLGVALEPLDDPALLDALTETVPVGPAALAGG
jgi:hypothetical protein